MQPEQISADLVEIWQRLLRVTDVPHDANFFEMGGRSGEFVRAALLIEDKYGVELSLRDFLAAPTIADLTQVVLTALSADGHADPVAQRG